jgi:hypothetical protein
MTKVLLNQMLHLVKRRERLWVMPLGTPWARRQVKLWAMRRERLLEKRKAET